MANKNYGTDKPAGDDPEAAAVAAEDTRQPMTEDPAPGDPSADAGSGEADKPARQEEPARPDKPDKPLDARERIAERFAQKRRDALAIPDKPKFPTPAESLAERTREAPGDDGDDGAGEEHPEAEAATGDADGSDTPAKDKTPGDQPKPVRADQVADDTIITLKVQGREIDLPMKEVRDIAQLNIGIAARERELRRLDERLRTHPTHQTPSDQAPDADDPSARRPGDRPTRDAPRQPTKLDEAQFRKLAEDIQGGTPEEAAEALKGFVSTLTESIQPPDVGSQIRAGIAAQRQDDSLNRDIETFQAEFPAIASDDDLAEIAVRRSVEGMIEDLRAAGVSDQELATVRNGGAKIVSHVHQDFQSYVTPDGRRGYPMMRPRLAIMADVGSRLTERFSIPKPADEAGDGKAAIEQRLERKRGLSPQPRTTNARAEAPRPEPAGRTPRTNVLKDMMKARGQRVA